MRGSPLSASFISPQPRLRLLAHESFRRLFSYRISHPLSRSHEDETLPLVFETRSDMQSDLSNCQRMPERLAGRDVEAEFPAPAPASLRGII